MVRLLLVAAGGALGAMARFGVSTLAVRALGDGFPYGTLAVNLVGCFLLGGLAHWLETTPNISELARAGLGIGLLGAMTTFSTFGVETFRAMEQGHWLIAAGNVAANVVLGLLAVWLGITLARAYG